MLLAGLPHTPLQSRLLLLLVLLLLVVLVST